MQKKAPHKGEENQKNKHESIIFRRDNSYYEKLYGVERCIDDEIPFDIPDSWNGADFVRLFLCFQEQILNPKITTTIIKEFLTLQELAVSLKRVSC